MPKNVRPQSAAEYRLNFRGMELLGTKTQTEMLRYRQNAHGDVIWMSNGTDTKTYFYDVFGQQVGENGLPSTDTADENPLRYCGEYFDTHSGNYYLRNRYYNPGTGRFTQEDPIHDGLNWYVYCGNNPVIFTDPLGLYTLAYGNNGRVYATIESGDTLSYIAYSEVQDAEAWRKINYKGDPSKIQVGEIIDITGMYKGHSLPYVESVMKNSNVPPPSSGYKPPKKGHLWDKQKRGWVDRYGNVWVPDKTGDEKNEHWDVQYPNGGYDNVYPDGRVRAGHGGRGRFSPLQQNSVPSAPQNKKIKVQKSEVFAVTGFAVGGYVIYQGMKWVIAGIAAAPTGGTSLIIAGCAP